jgi:hypothetical protein
MASNEGSNAAAAGNRPVYWWHGSDLAPFFARVEEMGGPDAVRITFDPNTRLLHVSPEGDAGDVTTMSHDDGFNFSHVCPPDCG